MCQLFFLLPILKYVWFNNFVETFKNPNAVSFVNFIIASVVNFITTCVMLYDSLNSKGQAPLHIICDWGYVSLTTPRKVWQVRVLFAGHF